MQGIVVCIVFVLMMLDYIFSGATWSSILAILAVDLITLIAATASCINLMSESRVNRNGGGNHDYNGEDEPRRRANYRQNVYHYSASTRGVPM